MVILYLNLQMVTNLYFSLLSVSILSQATENQRHMKVLEWALFVVHLGKFLSSVNRSDIAIVATLPSHWLAMNIHTKP